MPTARSIIKKRYYCKNRDKILSNQHKYYELNKDKILAQQRGYAAVYRKSEHARKKAAENLRKWHKTPKGIYKSISRRAICNNGNVCSQEEFIKWYSEHPKYCFYCGVSEEALKVLKNRVQYVNGMTSRLTIERFDNTKGYILDNITLACDVCNGVRGNILTVDEMKVVGVTVIKNRWKIE